MLEARSNRLIREKITHISPAIGVIFCGGRGTRIQEITGGTFPKHLLPITDTLTILDVVTDTLQQAGVTDIILATTDATHAFINAYVQSTPKVSEGTVRVVQNPWTEKKGAGSILKELKRYIPMTKPIITMNGDILNYGLNLKSMLDFHNEHPYAVTGAVTRNANGKHTVTLEQNSNIVRSIDTPKPEDSLHTFGLTGTWFISPSKIEMLIEAPHMGAFLQTATEQQMLYGYLFDGSSININTPSDYKMAQIFMASQII